MKKYNFLKEWNEYEKTVARVEKVFASWERKNLTITHGRRDINVSYTYGLPYTSSSSFAMLGNTNVESENPLYSAHCRITMCHNIPTYNTIGR